MVAVRANLVARYASLGISATISDFETEINQFLKPPVSQDISASTTEDTAINITLAGSDPEGESLTYTILEVNNATVTLNGNVANYTPNTNFNGTDTFTYKANDGTSDSNIATVTMSVSAEDDEPNTNDVSTTTDEDVAIVINLTADEYDGQNYSFGIIANPSNGTVSLSGTTATYTPNQDWNGTDTFTFEATDDRIMFGKRNVATATITVNAINDAPTSSEVSGSSDEDTAIDVALSATDVDQDNLTYSIVSDVSNGTTSISGSTLTYTPNQDWNGTDTFTYKVNDGTVDSNTSNGTITIAAINDAPVANDMTVSTNENRMMQLDITLDVTDIDGDNLTYTIVSDVSDGTTSVSASTVTYTPSQDWNGEDSFTYKANDGILDSNTATVTITVNPVDDSPINNSGDIIAIEDEDTTLEITIDATDADGDDLNITTSFQSSDKGTLTTDGLKITYVPEPNYYSHFDENGSLIGGKIAGFSYTVWDGVNGTGHNTDNHQINIYMRPVQDAPISSDLSVSVDEDFSGVENIRLIYSDPDSISYSPGVGADTVTYSIVTNPSHGSLITESSGPMLTYRPDENYNGSDLLTYKVNDSTVDSNISTVTITVNPINDAPSCDSVHNVSTNEDESLVINLPCTDVEGDALTTVFESNYKTPKNGTLSVDGITITYTPNANYEGINDFEYHVSDGTNQSGIEVVNITVNAVNDVPVVEDISADVVYDQYGRATAITLVGTDVEDSNLAYSIVDQPSNGTITIQQNVATFTPSAAGSDSFTYKATENTDDGAESAVGTVTLNITEDTAKVYPNDSRWTFGDDIETTSDGGLILLGMDQTPGGGSNSGYQYLVKTDASGNKEWSQTLGQGTSRKIEQTTDGGYVFVGRKGSQDAFITKTDASGNQEWSQTFGITGTNERNENFSSVKQTADGGYIIVGQFQTGNQQHYDAWLVKTDASGVEEWSKTYGWGPSGSEAFSDIQITNDGGFILVGYTNSVGAGGSDIYLVKVDSSGNEEWYKTFGGTSSESATTNSLQLTTDGGYIFGSHHIDDDSYIVKTDSSGDMEWDQTFNNTFDRELLMSIQLAPDGGYYLTGHCVIASGNDSDIYLRKIDSSGSTEWLQTYGGQKSDNADDVVVAPDGSLYVLGWTRSFGPVSTYNMYLIKVDSQGTQEF
jgi:hypothetical protein